jgi:outer membrane protein TolC
VAALNELEVRRSELEKRVGQVPKQLAALGAGMAPRPQPDDAEAWVAQARENNSAVRAQDAPFRAAEADPTLDAIASVGDNFTSGNLTLPQQYSTQAKNRIAGNQMGYKLGIRINSDVLGAEQQIYISRRDLAKARYDTLFQGLKLKAAQEAGRER